MLKKLTLFLFLLLLSSTLIAQQSRYVMKPGGELIKLDAKTDVRTAIQKANITDLSGKSVKSIFPDANIVNVGIADTLSYFNPPNADYTSRFGFFGQDVMLTWYVAPAEMVIKAIGVKPAADDVLGDQISIRLLKFNWTLEELNSFTAAQHLGYYPSEGDGFNNVAAFPEDATGDWVDKSEGAYPTPPWDHDAYDLWSDFGFGWPIEPVGIADTDPAYQWVETAPLGEPRLQQGEIFAIAVTHDGTTLDEERIGFWSMDAPATGSWSWKFYENGRSDPAVDPGWWAREYTFDFVAAVDLVGDRAPVISNVTVLNTTVSQDARTVSATITDDNPSGGPAGVASAELVYTVNGGAEQVVAMSEGDPDVYSGDIPGMTPGDSVAYYVRATDVEGLVTTSNTTSYQIYLPTPGVDVLVVINGYSSIGRLQQLVPYYFDLIGVMKAEYDLWYYGPVGADLLSHYTSVIEIQMNEGAPTDDNRDAYSAWVAEGNKNFLLAGQEALGFLYGYENKTFEPGSFEYDVLGVLNSYNDVSYAASGDQDKPSVFAAQAGSELGDSLATFMSTAVPDTLLYDPQGILGDANAANWLDQFDPRDDISNSVFMHGFAIDGTERPVGHNWETAEGSKVAFFSYDPLVLVQAGEEGAWVATSSIAPFHQAIQWFGLDVVGVRNVDGTLPRDFSLAQNYPNPFNPSTTIKYSVVENAKVSLKVYDILGKEVATLINETQAPGTYEFDFNASNLASGMYIYTLRAGDFVSSKKMMLLK